MSSGSTSPKFTLVKVFWEDAFDSENGWIHLSDYKPETARFETVGYLIPDLLDGYVSVTSTIDPDEAPDYETVGMVVHILVSMVTGMQVLD
jgi:hypothetical protein